MRPRVRHTCVLLESFKIGCDVVPREDTADLGKEPGQFTRELRPRCGTAGILVELFAYQIVERLDRTKPRHDALSSLALIVPDVLKAPRHHHSPSRCARSRCYSTP